MYLVMITDKMDIAYVERTACARHAATVGHFAPLIECARLIRSSIISWSQ